MSCKTCFSRRCWKVDLIVFTFLSFQLLAQQSDSTGIGLYFPDAYLASRPYGMGNAFAAVAHDVNIMRYNMGGLATLRYPSLGINIHSFQDTTHSGNFRIGLPSKFGTFGFDLDYFDVLEYSLDAEQNPRSHTIANEFVIGVGYGIAFKLGLGKSSLSLGSAIKYYNHYQQGQVISGSLLDAGLQLHLPAAFAQSRLPDLSVGAGVQNIPLSQSNAILLLHPISRIYRLGFAADFARFPLETWELLLTTDLVWRDNEKIKYYFGTELMVNRVFGIRAGYSDGQSEKWTAGFSLNFPTRWLGNSV